MTRIVVLILTIGFLLSCNTSTNKTNRLKIAKQFYKALDNSDGNIMKTLLTDSLQTKETDYDYKQTFSKNQYIEEWLKWDSIFDPTYQILKIEQEGEVVRATISKIDKRIKLLHEEPTVWSTIMRFENNKIVSLERSNVIFKDKVWETNRAKLLNWIEKNHPELKGSIYNQTEVGGLKFLKAIQLYNTANHIL